MRLVVVLFTAAIVFLPSLASADGESFQHTSLISPMKGLAKTHSTVLKGSGIRAMILRQTTQPGSLSGLTKYGYNLYRASRNGSSENFQVRSGVSKLSKDAAAGVELIWSW